MSRDTRSPGCVPVAKPKVWDTEFFGRPIYELTLVPPTEPRALAKVLAELDSKGAWGIEVVVQPEHMGEVPMLEDAGFRLVDSRMAFVSRMNIADVPERSLPSGSLRQALSADMDRVAELTAQCLVDNPRFSSRYKNPRLFSREESIRYYNAWNERCMNEQPGLFVVWDVDGSVNAYFNYFRADTAEHSPLFKGILTAVDPQYRGHDAHNLMQEWLFRRFGVSEWWIDNTTQISNIAVVRNHIKALKQFKGASLILYRTPSDK